MDEKNGCYFGLDIKKRDTVVKTDCACTPDGNVVVVGTIGRGIELQGMKFAENVSTK